MKIILSRKGFDSSFGGYPSIILPDKRMVTLPIPDERGRYAYSDLKMDEGKSAYDYMVSIQPKIKSGKRTIELTRDTKCHLDPDIHHGTLKDRSQGWHGAFGQKGAAQTVLKKNGVDVGDLFLFFGWFNHFDNKSQKITVSSYCSGGFHAVFGYLQIGGIIQTGSDPQIPKWLSYHPHFDESRFNDPNNCIYVAREVASWNENIKGYGSLKYDEALKLSADGLSRSKWNLPDFFRGLKMTYHNQNSWKDSYFQSACIGQEFVVEENALVEEWAKSLIESHQLD